MNDNEFNARIRELIKEIANLPQDQQKKLVPIVSKTKRGHQDVKKSIDKTAQCLDNLSIYIKYLLFDLEATRRERDKIKKMFDKLSSKDDKPNRTEGEM